MHLPAPGSAYFATTVGPGDFVRVPLVYPERVGEIYHALVNDAHRWTYFPAMQPDEALVFKCYDSEKDGRARFTAHGSFDDPNTPPNAPPRESIEIRTLALFGTV